jgi:hypothetical protein
MDETEDNLTRLLHSTLVSLPQSLIREQEEDAKEAAAAEEAKKAKEEAKAKEAEVSDEDDKDAE